MRAGPILRAALGVALLTGMDAVIKLQMQHQPFLVALFMRFAMGSLVSLLMLAAVRPPRPSRDSLLGNALRVPLVVLSAGSFFYSVSVLPLTEALTLAFLAPVFVAFFGAMLLGEKLDARILLALVCGFAGMIVMVWPRLKGGYDGVELGVASALFSAVAYALNLVLLRRIALREHPAIIVVFQNAGPALCLALPAAAVFVQPSGGDLAMYLLAGTLGVAGHFCVTTAFARAPASQLAAVDYTALIWASLLGCAIFGEVPLWTTYAGAALIIAGTLAVGRRRRTAAA